MTYPINPTNGQKIGANHVPRPRFPDLVNYLPWTQGNIAVRSTPEGDRNRMSWTSTETRINMTGVPNESASFTVDLFVTQLDAAAGAAWVGIRPAGATDILGSSVIVPVTSGYQRMTLQIDYEYIPHIGETLELYLHQSSSGLFGVVEIRVDYADSAIDGYFDGSTADTAERDYVWDGTAFASPSSALAIVVASGDTTPPTAPTGLAITGHTTTTQTLGWTAATDDVAVVGYHVYDGATKLTDPNPVTALTYTATGLEPESEHTYTVTAVDAANNESAASAPATGTTDAVPDIPPPDTSSSSFLPTRFTISHYAFDPDVDRWNLPVEKPAYGWGAPQYQAPKEILSGDTRYVVQVELLVPPGVTAKDNDYIRLGPIAGLDDEYDWYRVVGPTEDYGNNPFGFTPGNVINLTAISGFSPPVG